MVISCTVTQRFFDEKMSQKMTNFVFFICEHDYFLTKKVCKKSGHFGFLRVENLTNDDQLYSDPPRNNYAVNTTSKKM